jgi:hypothetical protein
LSSAKNISQIFGLVFLLTFNLTESDRKVAVEGDGPPLKDMPQRACREVEVTLTNLVHMVRAGMISWKAFVKLKDG